MTTWKLMALAMLEIVFLQFCKIETSSQMTFLELAFQGQTINNPYFNC